MTDKNASHGRSWLVAAGYMLLILMAVSTYCTQYVAGKFNYHPSLGSPIYGHIYNPVNWWRWSFDYFDYAEQIFRNAYLIFAAGAVFALLISKLIIGFKSRSSRKHEGIHGTAHFASPEEIRESGLADQKHGVYCGGYVDTKTGRTHYLRHDGPEHIAIVAPPRSGKGVGNIVPTLLSWLESVFVLDIKGENYAMSAGWRKRNANNVILRFDPAEEESCSWNPLGEIRFKTRHQISDAQNIALMIIDSDGRGLFDHWRKAAFELLGGMIMHALYKAEAVGRMPCIKDCADMLTSTGDFAAPEPPADIDDGGDQAALAGLFAEMDGVNLSDTNAADHEAALFIRGVGRSMASKPWRELNSIISTASTELALYRDPIVGQNTSRSDFKIADLMDHERPVSLYCITTPNNLARLSPLIRLLITRIVMGLTGQMTYDDGRSKTAHKHRLLMMNDEFASLGRLDIFEKAMAYIAGYGIKAVIIAQSLEQIKKAYTREENILANCHIQIAYAPNSFETAEWLSKMTGQTTVIKEQITTSGKRFGGVAEQFSRSYQEVRRPLLTPDEVRDLDRPKTDGKGHIINAGQMLIFSAGMQVILGCPILYYIDPTFNKRSRIPPPEVSDTISHDPRS